MRIIAGQFKGRRLLAPKGRTTRPLPDRAKESIFGILTPYLEGANAADLFCGTGSFGLEALSRGARHCWFADRDRSAIALLTRNIETVRAEENATVWSGDIERRLPAWLATLSEPLDIVFVDPPYALARRWASQGRCRVLEALAGAVAADGLVVYRTPRELSAMAWTEEFLLQREKTYASMTVSFLAPLAR